MKRNLFLLIVFLLIYLSNAQEFKNTLITINDEEITTEEFLKIYQKNLSFVKERDKKGIEDYLQTFIDYKLKVVEARRQGFHEKDSYKKELLGYRNQLTENYMTDIQASEELLKEAYQRLKSEVNASHILIRFPEGTPPEDTLKAYQKIHELRKLATSSNFDSLQKAVHNGRTVFGEDLGYFTVFRMVYPFESVAYKTPVDSVSRPFRTRFGYHFLKVNNKRLNRGEVEVAHIMISGSGNSSTKEPEKRIHEIYNRLKKGASFEELARQFSDDRGSALKDGKLPRFAAGRLSSVKFEDKAFEVKAGEISRPFQTKFGWHIIKGIRKYPIGSFEEEKAKLKSLLEKDTRSKIVSRSFINKLKNQYGLEADLTVRDEVVGLIDDSFYKSQWYFDKTNPVLDKQVLKIRDSVWKAVSFAFWLRQAQFKLQKGMKEVNFNQLFNDFAEDALLKYHEVHLELENEEFASILQEYREGLLLFDIMQEEVWDAADSIALERFYEKNKKQYQWKKRVNILSVSYTNQAITENLKRLMEKETNLQTLRKLTSGMPQFKEVIFTSSLMEMDDVRLPLNYKASKAWHEEKTASGFRLLKTIEVIKPSQKSFEEAKGAVLTDYQNHLEKEWLRSLRQSYRIKVDTKQLKKLKKRLEAK